MDDNKKKHCVIVHTQKIKHELKNNISNKEIFAKIRYKSTPAKGKLKIKTDGNAVFIFDEPQRAITPGQALVFYCNNEVIGGGFIEYEDTKSTNDTNKEIVKSY